MDLFQNIVHVLLRKKNGFFFVKIIVYMVIKYTIKSNVLYIMKKKNLVYLEWGGPNDSLAP